MRKISERDDGAFEYYISYDKKYVYYYGGHTGRRNGFFSEYDYYRFYASSHENVLYGPWQFLDCVPKECF